MAVPKKRKSKSKKNSRRAANKNLSAPRTQRCPNCGAAKLSHRVCSTCGHYKNEAIMEVWEY